MSNMKELIKSQKMLKELTDIMGTTGESSLVFVQKITELHHLLQQISLVVENDEEYKTLNKTISDLSTLLHSCYDERIRKECEK